jgi:hypothetical protein
MNGRAPLPDRQQQKNEQEGRNQILKRAQKREDHLISQIGGPTINPLDSFVIRHAKPLGFIAIEVFHNVIFHFVETVKVRGQARNLNSGDVSHYFKNSVEKKPLISGITSGFFGTLIGATAFMSAFDVLT